MKAAILKAPYELSVEDVPKPKPGFGEVLVKIKATAVCGTDLGIYKGGYAVKHPRVLGHETSGVVEELGEGVDEFQVGDRVVNNPLTYCGMCPKCYSGDVHLCQKGGLIGREFDGSFSEYMVLSKEKLFPLPDSISYTDGSNVNLLATCLWGFAKIRITPLHSVVVLGQGASGLLWDQLVKLSGASPVFGVSRSQWKLALGEQYGIRSLNPKEVNPVEVILESTQGKGADVVIECAGASETISQAMQMVAPGGTILQFGIAPHDVKQFDFPQLYYKEVKVVGTRAMRPVDFVDALRLIASGRVSIAPLVTHRFPLNQIHEAFRLADKGSESLRIVIEM